MVKKITNYLKFAVCCALIMSLVAPSYAALSASDGSAFVTKAEFDAALADFNSRLTTFEAGINSKIDSQVTSYLDRNGIWNGKEQTVTRINSLPVVFLNGLEAYTKYTSNVSGGLGGNWYTTSQTYDSGSGLGTAARSFAASNYSGWTFYKVENGTTLGGDHTLVASCTKAGLLFMDLCVYGWAESMNFTYDTPGYRVSTQLKAGTLTRSYLESPGSTFGGNNSQVVPAIGFGGSSYYSLTGGNKSGTWVYLDNRVNGVLKNSFSLARFAPYDSAFALGNNTGRTYYAVAGLVPTTMGATPWLINTFVSKGDVVTFNVRQSSVTVALAGNSSYNWGFGCEGDYATGNTSLAAQKAFTIGLPVFIWCSDARVY